MNPLKYSTNPIEAGKNINRGLQIELEKAKDRIKVLGENYPVYPLDITQDITGAPAHD